PDGSWMWDWLNPTLNLTPANLKLGKAVQRLGKKLGISAFTADRYFVVEPILGEELSEEAVYVFGMVVGGVLKYQAFYTMPFENGRVTALIRDARLEFDEPHPLARIATVFPQVLSKYTVLDHRAALLGYLEWYDYTPEQKGRAIRVVEDGEEVLQAKFDKRN